MAVLTTNLEVILASKEQIDSYYESVTNKINLLLNKYEIHDANSQVEQVSTSQLRELLSVTGFFQATPLKSIFFDQKQQYVPEEIVDAFRSIISDAPLNIKAVFFNTFITLLIKKGWDTSLSEYFEQQHGFPSDGIIILEDLKDFSLGFGVYKATFRLGVPHAERITIYLKRDYDLRAYNEIVYFHLQKKFLSAVSATKTPYILSNKVHDEFLLLSPLIHGIPSEIALSILTYHYKKIRSNDHKRILKKALDKIIEEFFNHAALADLLGRNDRHLMNSLIDFVIDSEPQNIALDDLLNIEKLLTWAQNIVENKIAAVSLFNIDSKWLLGEKNADWALIDIDFGLSEINLLSLLTEFNDFDCRTNMFFEQRKRTIAYYFNVYCQKHKTLMENKEVFLSAIKKFYPSHISDGKLKLLAQRISVFENSKNPIIKLFERYLLNYRIRLIHREALFALYKIATEFNELNILNVLKEADLLIYLPPRAATASSETSAFHQLQCFRGVLSKKDQAMLSESNRIIWETVASNISKIAKNFDADIFYSLEDKKKFIYDDTHLLLNSITNLLC